MAAALQGTISRLEQRNRYYTRLLFLLLLCIAIFSYAQPAHAQLPTCEYAVSDFTDGLTGIAYETGDIYPSGFFIQDDTAIGTTNMAYCPSGRDFIISGTVCRVQAIVYRSMFHVYCSIFLQLTPLIGIVLTLYIMFYGIAVLFGIKNTSPKTAGFMAIKMIIITLFITNADWMYFYLFRFLIEFMSEFSDLMLSTAPMTDKAGNIAIAYEYQGFWPPTEVYIAQNGEECASAISPAVTAVDEFPFVVEQCDPDVTTPDCTITVNVNGCTECEGSDCIPDPASSSTCTTVSGATDVVMREPAPPLDVRGNPVWCLEDGTGQIQYFDVTGDPAGTTMGVPTREPYNGGIFSRIDILFNQLVTSDKETGGLMFLAYAVSFMSGGMGFFLTILTLLGLIAIFMGFLRILIAYLTAVIALSFLLTLTPIFFAFGLFKETNPFFRRWLQNMFSYTLQPVLIMAFLYTLAEAGSIQNFINQMTKGHQLMETKQYVIGWEGFWQYTVEGPGFEQFTCYYEENGIDVLGKNCTAYSKLTGKPNATCVNYDLPANASTPYSQYPVNTTDPYSECGIRCWDINGRRRDDCKNLTCIKRGSDGEPNSPEEPTTGCVNPDQVKPLTRQATGLLLAWLIISAIIGGFVEMLPRLTQRLTKVLGQPVSTLIAAKSGNLSGVQGQSVYLVDKGASGLYTIEGMARPLMRRGQNILGKKSGQQGPLQKAIMGGKGTKRGQPNTAQKGTQQQSFWGDIFGTNKSSRSGGQSGRNQLLDLISGRTRR